MPNRFIFTVKTDNAGTSASNQFTIPTSNTGITQAFNYDIQTSDGQTITGLTGNHTITFPSAGTYVIEITGSFPYMFFNNGGDRLKMLNISQFGIYALGSTSQSSAFRGCTNMTITATDIGNFGSVTNFGNAWNGCSSLTLFPLIDTSSVTIFGSAWANCQSLTSFPLIDTSSGTNFTSAWFGCSSLTSFPLIDTSSGTNFQNAWFGCSSLTSFPLIDTSSGTNFQSTWRNCSSLTSFPLLNTSSGTNFQDAWLNCLSLTSFPLLDTSSGTNFSFAWRNCNSLTSFPLLDTSSGTNFLASWTDCQSLTSFPLIDTSSGTNFGAAWRNCSGLTSFPLLNTSSGTNFQEAWAICSSLTSFPLLDTSSGTNFQQAWQNCTSLSNYPANAFNNNIATNYNNAFNNTNLTIQSINNILVSLDTSGVNNGTFLQSGGEAPRNYGLIARDNLVAKGWTVTVTSSNDISNIDVALVRSPYYVNTNFDLPTTTKATIEVKVWDGDLDTPPAQPTYTLTRVRPTIDAANLDTNLSEIIRSQLKPKIPTFALNVAEQFVSSNSNSVKWVEYVVKFTDSQNQVGNDIDIFTAIDGFGYHSQNANPSKPDNRILLSNITNRKIARNGIVLIPFINDGLIIEVASPLTDTIIADTLDSDDFVQYLVLKVDEYNLSTKFLPVGLYYDTTPQTETVFSIDIIDECKFTPKNIIFKNKFGAFESISMFKRSISSIDVKKEEFVNKFTTNKSYDVTTHQYRDINFDATEKISLNSGYVSEAENETFKQLLLSDQVFFWEDGDLIPVNITSNSLTFKDELSDKLINYTIEFKYSFNTIQNV